MRWIAGAGALFVVGAPLLAAAAGYREGPLPAMTGGFGEQTCHTCHFDNRMNAQGGSLRLDGVPRAYVPAQEYPITVVVRRGGIVRAGFELSARVASGPRAGEQAGSLRGPDAHTQIVTAPGGRVQYIQHTKTGSAAAAGEGRWTVYWRAPAGSTDPVTFNVAANAANDDASPLGDFIYTLTRTTRRGSAAR